MNLVVVTSPTEEPVTVAQVKAQCRVENSADDALIAIYLTAAREKCEEMARRAFITQTLRLSLDEWPLGRVLRLPRPPLISVTSIIYTDDEGVATTWAAANYVIDTDSEPGRISPDPDTTWPFTSEALRSLGGIKITYTAGYGAASACPKKYQQAVLLLAAHFYERREASSEVDLKDIPFGVAALLDGDKGWY
jgi:uncharacterized phiE125 gp8 family phage protein